MKNKEEILEKLKKLLRLGQSSNPNEASLALERAFEIASQNNIDLASVDVDEETKRIIHERFGIGQRLSLVRHLALNIVLNFFNVNVILSKPDVLFVGTETDIQIGHYVLNFLTWACTKALSDYQKTQPRKLSKSKKRSFTAGYMYGVADKLGEAKQRLQLDESKTAIVLHSKALRDNYEKEKFRTAPVDRPDIGRRNRTALMEGFIEGNKLEIAKAVAQSKPGPLLLT